MLGLMKNCVLAFAIFVATVLSACTSGDRGISTEITRQFKAIPPGSVDLSLVGPPEWTRVCIVGPYTTNDGAEKQLGFKWDVDQHSGIGLDDSITLLVFVRESEVLAYTEHPRSEGDFLKLSARCFPRLNAKFVRNVKEGEASQLVANEV